MQIPIVILILAASSYVMTVALLSQPVKEKEPVKTITVRSYTRTK